MLISYLTDVDPRDSTDTPKIQILKNKLALRMTTGTEERIWKIV